MNRRLTVLATAFAIALVCTVLAWKVVAGSVDAKHRSNATSVVAAKSNIKLGTVLKAADLTTIEIGGTLPVGVIRDRQAAIDRGVVSDLYQGEPILESRLAPAGSGGGLAATIPNGMRACAVKVDDVVGVAGFVTPGMHVDVLISGTPPGMTNPTEGTEVRTLLQDLKVLSAGMDFQKDAEGKPKQVQVVNLLVTPEQAETLSLASNQARIQLVLRNPLDTQIAKVPGNAMGNLFSGGRPKLQTVAVRPVTKKIQTREIYTVEVINGSKGSLAKFGAPEGKQ